MLIKLFIIFAKIGAFSIGGGYAMLPFIQREVIEKKSLDDTWGILRYTSYFSNDPRAYCSKFSNLCRIVSVKYFTHRKRIKILR